MLCQARISAAPALEGAGDATHLLGPRRPGVLDEAVDLAPGQLGLAVEAVELPQAFLGCPRLVHLSLDGRSVGESSGKPFAGLRERSQRHCSGRSKHLTHEGTPLCAPAAMRVPAG